MVCKRQCLVCHQWDPNIIHDRIKLFGPIASIYLEYPINYTRNTYISAKTWLRVDIVCTPRLQNITQSYLQCLETRLLHFSVSKLLFQLKQRSQAEVERWFCAKHVMAFYNWRATHVDLCCSKGATVRQCFQTCVPEIKHLRIQQTLKISFSTTVLHMCHRGLNNDTRDWTFWPNDFGINPYPAGSLINRIWDPFCLTLD